VVSHASRTHERIAVPGFACRSCGAREIEHVLSLGSIPLANALVDPGALNGDAHYPLDLVRCPRCTLVQIRESVPPETLFRTYSYFSSYAETFVEHARRFAGGAIAELGLDGGSFVVEAASNDGYLLQHFVSAGVPSLGIEPARNVAAVARGRGIDTIDEFLDEELAGRIVEERGEADLVVANNVLAHVPELHGFVAALSALAAERGVVVVEVPYLRDLVDGLEFDTIYHEHLSYFTLTSLSPLFAASSLTILDVERLPVHGGSLRVRASRNGEPSTAVASLLEEERGWGVASGEPLAVFAKKVAALTRDVHELVEGLVSGGASLAAYGAAAKGVVLANVCALDAGLVRFVVDRNPAKQGKLLPGVRIPVEATESLAREQPDYCLLFAWNLADEILEQQSEYASRGGRFIVPVPEPRVLAG
jgi:hypothetical protein